MEKHFFIPTKYLSILLGCLIFLGLYLTSLYDYLLFHTFAEIFSVVIAFAIFVLAWNSRQFLNNHYFLFVGIAFLFAGFVDLLHALAYKGMGVFQGYDANLPTQLWIAFRYFQSLSFLIAPFFITRKIKPNLLFVICTAAVAFLLLSVFYWKIFPTCFIEGIGLTPFKKINEYIISLIFLASIVHLLKKRNHFDRNVLQWLVWSIFFAIVCELAFTFYISVYGLSNLIGHYFEILSFYFIYKAIIETGLTRPYTLLFKNLKQSEEALRKSESRYRSLFDNMTNGFGYHKVLFDDQGKPADYVFLEVNQTFENLTGLKKEAVIGKRVTEVLPGIGHDPAHWIGIYGRVAQTGEPLRFENYSEALKKWYSISAYSPEKGYLAAVFEDITERKTVEGRIAHLASFPELNPHPIVEIDLTGDVLYLNPAARQLFPDLQSIAASHAWLADFESLGAMLKETPETLHTREMKIGNAWYEQSVSYTPPWNRIRIYGHDITERKQAEEAIRTARDELEIRVQERTAELVKANELLEGMFSSIDTMIAYMDKDFNFIRVNRAYADADQREPEFYVGKNHFVLFPNEENEQIFRKVMETGEPYSVYAKPFEYVEHSERGVTHWDWSLQPVKEPGGSVGGVVLSLVNVTKRIRAEESVHQQAALLELAHDAVLVRDLEDRVLFWNHGAEEIYGWKKDEALGASIHDLLWTQYPKLLDEIKIDLMRKGYWEGELVHTRHDGKKILVESRWALQLGKEGRPTVILQINRDITERKELQRRIEATNALLNLFVRMPSRKEYLDAALGLIQNWSNCRCAGIRVLNEKDYIPYESYRGFSRSFWESENLLSVKYDQCACIRVVRENPDPQDHPRMTPAGSFWCNNTFEFVGNLSEEEKARFRGVCVQNGFKSVAIIPIRYREKILGAIHLADQKEGIVPLASIEFIESMAPLIGEAINRFNLEEELHESESRLRLLSSELLTVQEAERKRIAREIHDSIGQTLAAIKFGLESKLSQMGAGAPPPGVSIENIISLAQNGIEESRRIQMDLRPSILDDLGILATIGWFTREFQKIYSHISVEKEIQIEENDILAALKTPLFRIMQEAMNNVAKHSKADLVRLSLRKIESKIEMAIEDNGAGFDLESIKQGLGLTSMRERTELSGGAFEIESAVGKGTTIRARWTT